MLVRLLRRAREWVEHRLVLGHSQAVQHAARSRARLDCSDVEACRLLADDLARIIPERLGEEIASWFARDDYLNDSAYRLLVGVRAGGGVPPMPEAKRAVFAADEQLGRVGLTEAFRRVAALDPRLEEAILAIRPGDKPACPCCSGRPMARQVR